MIFNTKAELKEAIALAQEYKALAEEATREAARLASRPNPVIRYVTVKTFEEDWKYTELLAQLHLSEPLRFLLTSLRETIIAEMGKAENCANATLALALQNRLAGIDTVQEQIRVAHASFEAYCKSLRQEGNDGQES